MMCPCGSGRAYAACCEPCLHGQPAPTAEALMRSRYTAYVVGAIEYLGDSLHPDRRGTWRRAATAAWAAQVRWTGLEILATEAGRPGDREGLVEFRATYIEAGETGVEKIHGERSRFRFEGDRWYYVDAAPNRNENKPGRNAPCPCGSGRKYKKCCGATAA